MLQTGRFQRPLYYLTQENDMKKTTKILVVGGDKRMLYAARELNADCVYNGENAALSEKYGIIVLPVPLTRDGENVFCPLSETPFPFEKITEYTAENARIFAGGYSEKLWEICEKNGLTAENYLDSETLTLKNAKLTAEAAVMLMVQGSESALFGSTVLITGYGRIARYLSKALAAFGCRIIIAARKPEARISAILDGYSGVDISEIPDVIGECDYIANTVPARIFEETDFSELKTGAVFIELATLPPEPAKALCERNNAVYLHAGGLPGKYSPKAAGMYIAEEIRRRLRI